MNWLIELFTKQDFMQAVMILSIICAAGLALGKIKIKGISLGVTFVFFAGIIAGHFGIKIDPQMLVLAQNFGLILYIYSLGVQVNIDVQLDCKLRSKAIKPPKTTRIDTSGIIAFIPSAAPLLVSSVLSVSHALNAASFALEPKKVIIQSKAMTSEAPTVAAEAVAGITAEIKSVLISEKQSIEIPQST